MEESFIFNMVGSILFKLGSYAVKEIGLGWDAKLELRKLKRTMYTIRNVLSNAEEQQISNIAVKDWLQRLKFVVYDIDDLLDEFATEALRRQLETEGSKRKKVLHFFKSKFVRVHCGVSHRIKEVTERLDEIVHEMSNFQFIAQVTDRPIEMRGKKETYSFLRISNVVGREADKEAIIQLLRTQSRHGNVSIIPIVGMGGLGKTTLAKMVYNDNWVASQFEKRIWVYVSAEFDIKRIMADILGLATNVDCRNLGIEDLQNRLQEELHGKKFFLVLDDVWNEDRVKWTEFEEFLMVGAEGSRIVVTTRSKKVGSIMGSVPSYHLKGLSDDDCLSLLLKCAFPEDERKHHNLVKIGKEIIKKCGGIPLAAKTLGSQLYLKTEEHDWLLVRDNEIWKIVQEENDILPVIKLSFDQMPSNLKQCFIYCSLFEKGQIINKWKLIYLWMAQGFIHISGGQDVQPEDVGESHLDELVRRSFLEKVESGEGSYKMHDILHDLSRYVAGNEYCVDVESDMRLDPEKTRHVMYMSNSNSEGEGTLLQLKRLRTFFRPCAFDRRNNLFVDALITNFRLLRVLVLKSLIVDVPHSIGNLKHLRFLSLCDYRCETLPRSFGGLLNLQFLDLEYSRLHALPQGFEKLVSLRYLRLSSPSLVKIAGNFTGLRILCIKSCRELDALPSTLNHLTALEHLEIDDCRRLIIMKDDFQGLKSLKSLTLRKLKSGFSFPTIGLQHAAAATLSHISIERCTHLDFNENLTALTSLKTLHISMCDSIRSLPEGMHRLTALHSLKIYNCKELMQSIGFGCGGGNEGYKIAHVPEVIIDSTFTKFLPDGR